jgi:hypothetical protein
MGGGDAYEFVRDVVPTCLNVIVQCVDPNFKAKAGPAVGQAISILYTLKGLVCRCTVEGASYAVSVIGVFLNALDNMVGGWPGIIAKCFMTVAKLCVVAIPTQDIGTGKNLQVPDKVKEAARETLAELERRRSRVDASMRAVGEGSPHYLKLLKENDIINGHIQYIISTFDRYRASHPAHKFAKELRNVFDEPAGDMGEGGVQSMEDPHAVPYPGYSSKPASRSRSADSDEDSDADRRDSKRRRGGSLAPPPIFSVVPTSVNKCNNELVDSLVDSLVQKAEEQLEKAEGYTAYRY